MSGSNLDQWRLPERMQVVASTGNLRDRMAGPTREQIGNRSDYLRDDGRVLPYEQPEVSLAGDVTLARSSTGGLSIRSGRLRETLAAAETDALIKLRAAKAAKGG